MQYRFFEGNSESAYGALCKSIDCQSSKGFTRQLHNFSFERRKKHWSIEKPRTIRKGKISAGRRGRRTGKGGKRWASATFFSIAECMNKVAARSECPVANPDPISTVIIHTSQFLFLVSHGLHQKYIGPNKKRSLLRLTRPTVFWSADRTLFFDFASDTFWRRSVRGQLRRQSWSRERSRRVKIKQREGDLDCWPRLLSRDPGTRRDVRRYSIDATRFLSPTAAAANRASFSLLATCCFNFETDMYGFHSFFGRFVLAQLISCFSSMAMPMAVSVNFPAGKKPFCRGRLLHVDEDATLLSVLRVALGDNDSFASLRFRDLTKQEKTSAMSFFTSSSKTIKRSSSRRSSRQRTRARHTNVANRPHARPGRLWQRRSSGGEVTGT